MTIEKAGIVRYNSNPNNETGSVTKMATVKYLSVSPNILGGAPVITGTRIPAARISALLLQGYNEAALVKEFGTVSPRKLRGAMYELTLLGIQKLDEIQHEPRPAHV